MQPLDAHIFACNCSQRTGANTAGPLRRCKRNHGTSMPMPAFCLQRRKSEAIATLLAQLDARESAPVDSGVQVRRQLSFCANSEMAHESDGQASLRRLRSDNGEAIQMTESEPTEFDTATFLAKAGL